MIAWKAGPLSLAAPASTSFPRSGGFPAQGVLEGCKPVRPVQSSVALLPESRRPSGHIARLTVHNHREPHESASGRPVWLWQRARDSAILSEFRRNRGCVRTGSPSPPAGLGSRVTAGSAQRNGELPGMSVSRHPTGIAGNEYRNIAGSAARSGSGTPADRRCQTGRGQCPCGWLSI